MQTPTPQAGRGHLRESVHWAVGAVIEVFRKDPTPAALSLFAVALAMAPGIREVVTNGRPANYDSGLAVLTATLVALIWTAHYTYRSVRHAQKAVDRDAIHRSEARLALTAAVLVEIDAVHAGLEVVADRVITGGVSFLKRPQLERALSRVDLFPRHVIAQMTHVDGYIRTLESIVSLYELELRARDDLSPSLILDSGFRLHENRVSAIRETISEAHTQLDSLRDLLVRL